ncbi:unnamed protein product [Ceratitis capitata]|uniref:(Mediterranean fruit fly) hypothetical protein n=1 Tax=Ceratitis capitata TaxID=7213 RepID=A0A811USH6_CERCA|nr:unnamed protein product [Ceratitis capitata]
MLYKCRRAAEPTAAYNRRGSGEVRVKGISCTACEWLKIVVKLAVKSNVPLVRQTVVAVGASATRSLVVGRRASVKSDPRQPIYTHSLEANKENVLLVRRSGTCTCPSIGGLDPLKICSAQ